MNTFAGIQSDLGRSPRKWLVTGAAGFIGSNLLEALLKLNQEVVGLDSFITGHRRNLDEVQSLVTPAQWERFTFLEGNLCDLPTCRRACRGVEYVLHQAALGSVPRSFDNPIATNENNLVGFLNVIVAARDAGVNRFVYASSSSVYGDHPDLPKVEGKIGRPLSPYALTKQMNEAYAGVFAAAYGIQTIGLRYFNVFGPRQDPNGPYAAVIPKWYAALRKGGEAYINGDGETSRDFCYVENVIQANLLAACTQDEEVCNQVFNIAYGERTTLNELFGLIRGVASSSADCAGVKPAYRPFRPGDIRHSLADIGKAKKLLGYEPQYSVRSGLEKAGKWYLQCAPRM